MFDERAEEFVSVGKLSQNLFFYYQVLQLWQWVTQHSACVKLMVVRQVRLVDAK